MSNCCKVRLTDIERIGFETDGRETILNREHMLELIKHTCGTENWNVSAASITIYVNGHANFEPHVNGNVNCEPRLRAPLLRCP